MLQWMVVTANVQEEWYIEWYLASAIPSDEFVVIKIYAKGEPDA